MTVIDRVLSIVREESTSELDTTGEVVGVQKAEEEQRQMEGGARRVGTATTTSTQARHVFVQ